MSPTNKDQGSASPDVLNLNHQRSKQGSQKIRKGKIKAHLGSLMLHVLWLVKVSVFRDGVRAGEPQKLPEHLANKTLFPTVTFKGAFKRLC